MPTGDHVTPQHRFGTNAQKAARKETMLAASDQTVRFWDLWGPDYNCPYMKERIGKVGDGGKWVSGLSSLLQRPHCLVISIGSNGEPSFEEAILSRTACEVHTWDHTLDEKKRQAVLRVPGIILHDIGPRQ